MYNLVAGREIRSEGSARPIRARLGQSRAGVSRGSGGGAFCCDRRTGVASSLHAPIIATSSRVIFGHVLLSAINAADTAFLTESTLDRRQALPIRSRIRPAAASGRAASAANKPPGARQQRIILPLQLPNVTLSDFAGVQIRARHSTLNFYGWEIHLGSTLGYLGATGKDATSLAQAVLWAEL